MGGVVGREVELATVEGVLAATRTGLAVLTIEGDSGIGKTTLWREAVARAERADTSCSRAGRRRPRLG